jgi:hypothetical protein
VSITTTAELDQVHADAEAYRRLRDRIIATMPAPDAWGDDDAEEEILAQYVEHLAAGGIT